MNSSLNYSSANARHADFVREARRNRTRPAKVKLDDVELQLRRPWLRLLQVSRSAA